MMLLVAVSAAFGAVVAMCAERRLKRKGQPR